MSAGQDVTMAAEHVVDATTACSADEAARREPMPWPGYMTCSADDDESCLSHALSTDDGEGGASSACYLKYVRYGV